jgi:prephenate dehydratase
LAVVASQAAAGRYGLVTLAEDVQNEMRNMTRFSILQARHRAGGRG